MALLFLLPCLLAALSLTVSHALLPVPPHYKQCDPRWGSDTIGQVNVSKQDDSTICHVGCAMTSLSMLLATVNTTTTWLKDSQHTVTPKSLNVWLQHHQGYDCVSVHQDKECFDLMSAAIGNLTGRIVYNVHDGNAQHRRHVALHVDPAKSVHCPRPRQPSFCVRHWRQRSVQHGQCVGPLFQCYRVPVCKCDGGVGVHVASGCGAGAVPHVQTMRCGMGP